MKIIIYLLLSSYHFQLIHIEQLFLEAHKGPSQTEYRMFQFWYSIQLVNRQHRSTRSRFLFHYLLVMYRVVGLVFPY